ncbi:sugar isomerase domain-containing protein [Kineosporia babensis]|uniref:SIS domain-containing protein n=1 Tax=Kineosporia babensis TaxID=499548 RepID=A0A9X1NEZ2_9ACTN|nr:SIS domain-containing protein [Kineosporia babensis]MCD5312081.1 SIS domain-containing protein [Kineosporia babensis]
MPVPSFSPARDLHQEVSTRLAAIAEDAAAGALEPAIALLSDAIEAGGVIQAFGTGHSEAFAMEIAGRAGGLIPTNKVALRNVVLHGKHSVAELAGQPPLERDPRIAEDLFATIDRDPADVFVIASNSGVNGSIVGTALLAQEHGHKVIAVTSLAHTAAVTPKHPSGKRLSEIADVVIDNRAPYGDTTLESPGGLGVGAVSSITSAFIAQLLTVGIAHRLGSTETPAPLYISANIPSGDEHNHALESKYGDRIRRYA